MKKKTRKLTAIIMLAIMTLLCFSVFSACGEEKSVYKVRMHIIASMLANEEGLNLSDLLTSDNPTVNYEDIETNVEMYIEVSSFSVCRYNEKGTLKEIVDRIFPWPVFVSNGIKQLLGGRSDERVPWQIIPEYTIVKADGETVKGKMRVGEDYSIHLERVVGQHTLKYRFPALMKYGLEETNFLINIDVKEDTRPDRVVIDAEPSNEEVTYTKIPAKDENEYDMYVVKGDRIPKFTARLKESPNENLVLEDGEVVLCTYYEFMGSKEMMPSSRYFQKGVYLLRTTYGGRRSRYRHIEYWCYIVIQG